MQLIKTAIIKAGNSAAAFTAVAQRCPAASMVQLLCVSPQSPRQAPPAARWSYPQVWPPPRMALPVHGGSSGKACGLAHSFIKYLCSACCVPGPVPPIHCPVSWPLPRTPPVLLGPEPPGPLSSSQYSSLLLDHSLPHLPGFSLTSLSALQPPLPLLVSPAGEPMSSALLHGQSLSLGQLTHSCSFRYLLYSCSSQFRLSNPNYLARALDQKMYLPSGCHL